MALSKEEILEAISEMSVMDIVDLIAAMEEKFGVSATVAAASASSTTSSTVILEIDSKSFSLFTAIVNTPN